MSLAEKRKQALNRLSSLQVVYGGLQDPVSSLSGGNQQKLVFAREIAADPALLVVSQPTRGVDLKGIDAIHKLMTDFRNRGGAVFLVSEELEELLSLCDRIYVMAAGRMVGEAVAAETDMMQIGRMMVLQGHGDD
jgi:simple sugar transport system ATP-binding protein